MTGEWFESLIHSLRESGQTDEQRRAIRVGIRFTAKLAPIIPGQTPQAFTIWVKDVSRQGIGFTADRPLSMGQKVAIWVPQAKSEPLRILAEIRNCRPLEDDLHAVGALFIHMSPAPPLPKSMEPAANSPPAQPPSPPVQALPRPAPAPAAPPSNASLDSQLEMIRRAMFD